MRSVARQSVEFCTKAIFFKYRCRRAGKYSLSCSVLRIVGCKVCKLHRTEVVHCLQTRCICLWVTMLFLRTTADRTSLGR